MGVLPLLSILRCEDGRKGRFDMIVTDDGYAIEQHQGQNKIVILMPQTAETITNTVQQLSKRRVKLTENELLLILNLVRLLMMDGKEKTECVKT